MQITRGLGFTSFGFGVGGFGLGSLGSRFAFEGFSFRFSL